MKQSGGIAGGGWRNQYMPRLRQWNLDASLFRNVRIYETVGPRFNAGFFNLLNHPNNPNNIGGDGFLNTRASGLPARAPQLGSQLRW